MCKWRLVRSFICVGRRCSLRAFAWGPILYDIESLCFTVRFPFPFCSLVIVGRVRAATATRFPLCWRLVRFDIIKERDASSPSLSLRGHCFRVYMHNASASRRVAARRPVFMPFPLGWYCFSGIACFASLHFDFSSCPRHIKANS